MTTRIGKLPVQADCYFEVHGTETTGRDEDGQPTVQMAISTGDFVVAVAGVVVFRGSLAAEQ